MSKRTLIQRAAALILTIISLSAVPATAIEPKTHRPFASEVWARTELYFGSERPGGEVTEAEFTEFADRIITPRFPDGLTLLTGYGQFLSSTGRLIKERSKVLIVFYPVNAKDANKNIQEIREAYKSAFQQESVLRIDSYTLVSF
jgi:hypothetical protein